MSEIYKDFIFIGIALALFLIIALCGGCSVCPAPGSKALIKGRLCINTCIDDTCGNISKQRIGIRDVQIKDLKHRLAEEVVLSGYQEDKIKLLENKVDSLENTIIEKDKKINSFKEQIKEKDREALTKKEQKTSKHYVVAKDDWLSSLSEAIYGDLRLWPYLYWYNSGIIDNPDLIYPGQVLDISRDWSSQQKGTAISWHVRKYGR